MLSLCWALPTSSCLFPSDSSSLVGERAIAGFVRRGAELGSALWQSVLLQLLRCGVMAFLPHFLSIDAPSTIGDVLEVLVQLG